KGFVEPIWARRKVGYLLDQIRANGESKELKDEVVALAKKNGITTPYTSWLIGPDGPMPVAGAGRRGFDMRGVGARAGEPVARAPGGRGGGGFGGGGWGALPPTGLAKPGGGTERALDFAARSQSKPGEAAQKRGGRADDELKKATDAKGGDRDSVHAVKVLEE